VSEFDWTGRVKNPADCLQGKATPWSSKPKVLKSCEDDPRLRRVSLGLSKQVNDLSTGFEKTKVGDLIRGRVSSVTTLAHSSRLLGGLQGLLPYL